jgi:RNA polymerase sigma-70 factor (ECF subfamily)
MDAGLAAVFMENRPALLRFLHARGASDAAEDLLQELWIKAAAGAAEPIADPLAYLYRTANNLLLDRRRSELRRGRREESWTYSAGGWVGEASDLESGERRAIAREQLRVMETALSELGQPTEGIFRRFRVEGIGQRQIANEMGISLSAVEKHLQKAYRLLLQIRRQSDAG